MHQPARTLFLTVLLAAVFAPATPAQTTLRYRFTAGEKLSYVIDQKTNSKMNLMGAEIVSQIGATLTIEWEVLKVDGAGSAQVRIKTTHTRMSLDSLLGMTTVDSKEPAPTDPAGRLLAQVNSAFAAMEITATMLPTGELKDVKVSEATIKAMKAIPSADKFGDLGHPDNFKDMLGSLVFPTGPVAKGASWKHKTESESPEGKLTTEHVYTLEETVEQSGAKLEKISLKPSISIVADPKAMVKLKSVKAAGHALFDNKTGRFVESTVVQTKQGKIDVMGLTLDNTSEQTTTIRLKVATAEEKTALAKSVQSIKIDETEFVEKVVANELLETLPGVARSFTVERSFEPAITLKGAAPVADDLKSKVEAALSLTIGKKTVVKESVTLDGKEITKVNVQWVERYRQGTAVMGDGSTATFLVRVGVRFKLEKAK